MAAGRGDELEAGGRSRLRASHADREQVIGTLKAAFVQGRLAKDELDARLGQAFAARTYADLAAVTADLPARLADAAPPQRAPREQARPPMSTAAKAGICAAIAIAVPVVLSIPTGGFALAVFVPFYFMALLVAAAQMLASRHEKRSRRGQLPPRPAQGGPAVEGGPDGQPGGDRILCQAQGAAGARHLPGREVIRRTVRSRSARRDQRPPASLQVTA